MLIAICVLMNIFIVVYLGKKNWKGFYNLYLIFIALMGFMAIFYIDEPELKRSIVDLFGKTAYKDLRMIFRDNAYLGVTPFVAVELVSMLLATVFALDLTVETIIYFPQKAVEPIAAFFKEAFSFDQKVIGANSARKFALYCNYRC